MSDYCKRCDEPRLAFARGLCPAHLRRERLGRNLDAPIGHNYPALSPKERLTIAALQFAAIPDYATAEEYRRAVDRLRKAAMAYAKAQRKRAPSSGEDRAQA